MSEHPETTDPNELTLRSYNKEILGYIKNTPATYQTHHTPLIRWIDSSLSLLSHNVNILEIGSGTGREAAYIKSKGFNVVCSDGAEAFVRYLRQAGHEALPLNILTDSLPKGFDMIFANAVIPHFTPQQFQIVLTKVMDSLPPKGLFAFSVKQGCGEQWITEKFASKRFIHYWCPEILQSCLTQAGCSVVFWEDGIPGDLPSHTWTNLTVQKTK